MDWKTIKEMPPWEWPEGTAKTLLTTLVDERTPEPDRLLAVELAGNFTVVDDALADALLSTLGRSENSVEVRRTAALSLGPILEHADTAGFEDAEDAPISEQTYRRVAEAMHQLYGDASVPKEVRRRILEASVRAPQPWHRDAVRAAFSSDDDAWRLTAVFCMGYVAGFDRSILEALSSENRDIHYEAVVAAGEWGLDEAWSHVASLLSSGETEKGLLLAAIEAAVNIRPEEAAELLSDLAGSEDEDVVAGAEEALAVAEGSSEHDEDKVDD